MPNRVRKLSAILTVSILIGCLACCAAVSFVINNQIEAALAQRTATATDAVQRLLARAESLGELTAIDAQVQKAMAQGDRSALLAQFAEYPHLAEHHALRQFHFYNTASTTLARLHQPMVQGEALETPRATVLKANRTGQPVVSIERHGDALSVRAVEPIFYRSHRVGAVEFGYTLDQAWLTTIPGQPPAAIYLLTDGQMHRYATNVPTEGLANLLDSATEHPEGAVHGRSYAMRVVPLTDAEGEALGQLVVSLDMSTFYEHRNFGWSVIIAVTVLVLGLLGFISLEANRHAANSNRVRDGSAFDAQLGRALHMAHDETNANRVMRRAITGLVPDRVASLLLADNSGAHLESVVTLGDHAGCSPETPYLCPAAASGQSQWFPDSDALDACPQMFSCSQRVGASCHPVAVAGVAVGVLHVQHAHLENDTLLRQRLEQVAGRFGDKLTILRAMAESETAARTDPLTGLLNRRSFRAAVLPMIRAEQPYSVLFADLDHFKRLNDTYGHDVGDRALRRFATLLGRTVGELGLVCRQGGEEFVVFLPGMDAMASTALGDRLRAALAQTCAEGSEPGFTVSLGAAPSSLSLNPFTADGMDEVINRADQALLAAKEAGRDRVVVAGEPTALQAVA